jgi:uncharacterized protein YjcR
VARGNALRRELRDVEARKLRADGLTFLAIADRLGCSVSTVHAAASRGWPASSRSDGGSAMPGGPGSRPKTSRNSFL